MTAEGGLVVPRYPVGVSGLQGGLSRVEEEEGRGGKRGGDVGGSGAAGGGGKGKGKGKVADRPVEAGGPADAAEPVSAVPRIRFESASPDVGQHPALRDLDEEGRAGG